jgi:hypothetical protein
MRTKFSIHSDLWLGHTTVYGYMYTAPIVDGGAMYRNGYMYTAPIVDGGAIELACSSGPPPGSTSKLFLDDADKTAIAPPCEQESGACCLQTKFAQPAQLRLRAPRFRHFAGEFDDIWRIFGVRQPPPRRMCLLRY